jgi:hypothetical protein
VERKAKPRPLLSGDPFEARDGEGGGIRSVERLKHRPLEPGQVCQGRLLASTTQPVLQVLAEKAQRRSGRGICRQVGRGEPSERLVADDGA